MNRFELFNQFLGNFLLLIFNLDTMVIWFEWTNAYIFYWTFFQKICINYYWRELICLRLIFHYSFLGRVAYRLHPHNDLSICSSRVDYVSLILLNHESLHFIFIFFEFVLHLLPIDQYCLTLWLIISKHQFTQVETCTPFGAVLRSIPLLQLHVAGWHIHLCHFDREYCPGKRIKFLQ